MRRPMEQPNPMWRIGCHQSLWMPRHVSSPVSRLAGRHGYWRGAARWQHWTGAFEYRVRDALRQPRCNPAAGLATDQSRCHQMRSPHVTSPFISMHSTGGRTTFIHPALLSPPAPRYPCTEADTFHSCGDKMMLPASPQTHHDRRAALQHGYRKKHESPRPANDSLKPGASAG